MSAFVLEIIPYILSAILGLCLGSFATAVLWRGGRGLSWIAQNKSAVRSMCPECGARLSALELVPLFSWLALHGKCRTCQKAIPVLYPLVELATMVLTVAMFWAWGASWLVFPLLLSVPFLLAATVIDWEHMILPDDINVALFVLAVTHTGILWWQGGWDVNIPIERIAAAILLVTIFALVGWVLSRWKGRDALGWGDIKLMPTAGLFLGLSPLPFFMVTSGVLGLLTGVLKRKNGHFGQFPFGPALIISLYLHVFLTGLGFYYRG